MDAAKQEVILVIAEAAQADNEEEPAASSTQRAESPCFESHVTPDAGVALGAVQVGAFASVCPVRTHHATCAGGAGPAGADANPPGGRGPPPKKSVDSAPAELNPTQTDSPDVSKSVLNLGHPQ